MLLSVKIGVTFSFFIEAFQLLLETIHLIV